MSQEMTARKNFFWLALVLLISGDFFYFASLLFRSFTVDLIILFSTEYNSSDLGNTGEKSILFLTSLIGAMLYLIGFLLIALSRETLADQKKIAFYGLLVWFITDSFASLIFGFGFNVIFNLTFLAVGLVLLNRIKTN